MNERGGADAPFDPALAAMLKARCAGRCARVYTKTADAFSTEDAAGDMAEDESCESGECGGTDAPFGPALTEMPDTRTEDVPGELAEDESCESGECGGTDAPFGPALTEMLDARIYTKVADAFNTEDAACRRHAADEPTNPANERGGTDAPFGPALAAMPDARCADAFNTEDAAGDMAADESYGMGE